jgi:hypothetical protein
VVRFGRPKKIYATNAKDTLQRVLSLAAGEKREVSFTIGAEKGYWIDTIPISVSVNYKELSQQQLTICTAQFAPPVAPPPVVTTADYINLTWITPNEDAVGNTIITNEQKINIKINAKSNKPLHRDSFEVISKHQQIGGKFDKVKLVKFSDGASIKSLTIEHELDLQEGDNEIKVRVKNGSMQEESATIKVRYVLEQPSLHVLSIGIISERKDLEFPQKDAADFAAIFQQKTGHLFKKVHVKILNRQANTIRDSVMNAISDIENNYYGKTEPQIIQSNDVIVLFISTHGNQFNNKRQYYLQPSNYSSLYEKTTGIDFNEGIINTLSKVPCKKFIFLDACYSGLVDSLNIPNDFAVLTSSGPQEQSWENPVWQNGAFTHSIKEAINKLQGNITMTNLFAYLNQYIPQIVEKVLDDTKKKQGISQHPMIITNSNLLRGLPLLHPK